MSYLRDLSLLDALQADTPLTEPASPSRIQPSSIDLTLGSRFLTITCPPGTVVDPIDGPGAEVVHTKVTVDPGDTFVIQPGQFVLAETAEVVNMPTCYVGRVEGKSSLGRHALFIHATAGLIDPGFRGHVTLELFCAAPYGLALTPGMDIGQLSIASMDGPAQFPYGHGANASRYQGQDGPTPSRYHVNRRRPGNDYPF